MWKPGEMEAPMRPNPYSSSTIDMRGKRGFGILFSNFLRFFEIFLLRRVYRCASCRHKSIKKAFAVIRKRLQMPSVMELVGYRAWKYDEEKPGVPDGGTRVAAMGVGHGIPSRRARRKKRNAAGRVCLSLARRYNTLDLASKVSVPRGCGPFGNLRRQSVTLRIAVYPHQFQTPHHTTY